MRIRTTCLTLSFSLALLSTGCTSVQNVMGDIFDAASLEVPADAQFAFKGHGTGYQQFQCAVDKRGYFWRFITPHAEIVNGDGELVATQGADLAFVAPDGAHLKAKIVAVRPSSTNRRLKDVLFAVTQHGAVLGELNSYRWISREDASGGVPTEACTAENLGNFIQVPFSATYRFYK